ncbi:hypothetical protein CPT_Mater88 [Bacillus phage Mater]|uniref:Uncharacterized protein n=1 Tax=Bacillus phage Mater TaxID=1540090 RepID=A0A0A0RMF8_9CAUD|nr:hypothetical protein CPT_Mater88 [Bacillus phage Mater]AIW03245.1 hypothetical protein CPT_Mater88 [Bacillus phage Mater]
MVKCEHCGAEYPNYSAFGQDCFISSDGWSWEYFHNCLKDEDHLIINGYKKKEEN